MIALKELRLIPLSRSRNWQVRNLPYRGFQIACVMSIAVIWPLHTSLVRLGSNEGRHFFLPYTHQCDAHRLPQSLFHHLLKDFLTCFSYFDMLVCTSHRYPPGYEMCELNTSSRIPDSAFYTQLSILPA